MRSILDTCKPRQDTNVLRGAESNAQTADRENPHPDGYPLYELAWRAVFLHSLVGRDQGIKSEVFGITEKAATFDVAFPGLMPPQVSEPARPRPACRNP